VDAYLRQVNEPDALRGGLMVVDADNFKAINDRFGHAAGNSALKLIALGARSALRAADLIGRVGGEEFAVFLPRAGLVEARNIGERVRSAVGELDFRPLGVPETLTVSVGGTVFQGPVSLTELFESADACLYAAKRRGRIRVEFSTTSTTPSPGRRTDKENLASLVLCAPGACDRGRGHPKPGHTIVTKLDPNVRLRTLSQAIIERMNFRFRSPPCCRLENAFAGMRRREA
jgi:diguanylate cyclase (GGDEF)-like protein